MKKGSIFLLLSFFVAGTALAQNQFFKVRIENTGGTGSLPILFSPGVWAVHTGDYPIFEPGMADYGMGLEAIAEDGDPTMLAASLPTDRTLSAGAFTTAVGANEPGPLTAGNAFEFIIQAKPGDRLSLASMFAQSNDIFLGTSGEGMELFDGNGDPVTGSINSMLEYWDAGTEANEPLGTGPNQAPRQSAPNTGDPDPDNTVRVSTQDGLALSDQVLVTVEPMAATELRLTIENVSAPGTLETSTGEDAPIPLSPGVWVVHTGPQPLFTNMEMDYGLGLEGIAEDGDPTVLADNLAMASGISSGVFNTPVGAGSPGPATPGNHFDIRFEAVQGTRLSLATMFAQSNDAFYAAAAEGIELWDEEGNLRVGDLTAEFSLWDAGTEENERPGEGTNQAPRQSGPDTGPADTDPLVRLVNDGFDYPDDMDVIRVTLSVVSTASEEGPAEVPATAILHQNYPNPFNPETTISFDLDTSSPVVVTVHDVLGREIARLADGRMPAGAHTVTWDGLGQDGQRAATGVYFYRLKTTGATLTRSMTLIK